MVVFFAHQSGFYQVGGDWLVRLSLPFSLVVFQKVWVEDAKFSTADLYCALLGKAVQRPADHLARAADVGGDLIQGNVPFHGLFSGLRVLFQEPIGQACGDSCHFIKAQGVGTCGRPGVGCC